MPFPSSYVLDRAAHLRTREGLLSDKLADDRCLFVPVWRNRNLVDQSGDSPVPVLLERSRAIALLELATEQVFLGLLDDRPVFGIALPGADDTPKHPALAAAGDFNDLRFTGGLLEASAAGLLGYARGILYWHRHQQHCGRCGAATTSGEGGHVRVCQGCDKRHFPRTDPAVMALIIHEERCLLARQSSFPPNMYSILAGFVEPGESLEQAVVREVHEEVGLDVVDVRYLRSQPWPFPASLMLGFAMRATGAEIVLDSDELEDARWLTREQIRETDNDIFTPPIFSLAGQLIELFVEGRWAQT